MPSRVRAAAGVPRTRRTGGRMQQRLAVLLAALLAACDPGYFLRIQQPVPRAPALDCLRAALEESPQVRRHVQLPEARTTRIAVAVEDSLAPGGSWELYLTLPRRREGGSLLHAEYVWLGTVERVPAAEQRAMVARAALLLDELRGRCAPEAAREITCTTAGIGRPRVCTAATSDLVPAH